MAASHLILLSHEAGPSQPYPALPTLLCPTLDSLMDRQISVQHALNIDLLPCLPSFHVCDIAFVITLICTVSVVCRLVFFFPSPHSHEIRGRKLESIFAVLSVYMIMGFIFFI